VLRAPHPNPFNPLTNLAFELEHEGVVRLDVLDVNGELVRRLVDERLEAGQHASRWDGRDRAGRRVASGVYVVRLRAAGREQTRRIVLLK
jgi:flagellar hook assembly protein FlgD